MQPYKIIIGALIAILLVSFARIISKGQARKQRIEFARGRAAGRKEAREETHALIVNDLQTLNDISETLQLAHRFWLPIQGTQPHRKRVVDQLDAIRKIALRIRDQQQTPNSTVVTDQENAA